MSRSRELTTATLLIVIFMTSIFAVLVPAFAGKHGPKGKSNVGHLYLYEKDP